MIPSQVTGRVELRRRLANTITQIGRLYSLLASSYMVSKDESPTDNQRKQFRKLTLEVQRQLADERTLLTNARFEPPLRGTFPSKEYTTLLQSVENMADLVESMVRKSCLPYRTNERFSSVGICSKINRSRMAHSYLNDPHVRKKRLRKWAGRDTMSVCTILTQWQPV